MSIQRLKLTGAAILVFRAERLSGGPGNLAECSAAYFLVVEERQDPFSRGNSHDSNTAIADCGSTAVVAVPIWECRR